MQYLFCEENQDIKNIRKLKRLTFEIFDYWKWRDCLIRDM